MTKIISYNVNGIRAALRKGFDRWLQTVAPDIVCLQEVKALINDIDINIFEQMGYEEIKWNGAQKKGYSGTALLSKQPLIYYQDSFDFPVADSEGRIQLCEFNDFTLLNVYFPSGSSSPLRQNIKIDFLHTFENKILKKISFDKPVILCGDFNICHQVIDIHDPVRNLEKPGFTSIERNWFSSITAKYELTDVFRYYFPEKIQYSWWSYISAAKKRNAGWRIDYFLISQSIINQCNNILYLQKANFSDHCPLLLKMQ